MKPWCEATTPSLASRDRRSQFPILLTHRQALLAPSTHAMAPDAHHGAMPNPLGRQPWNAMDRIVNLHRSRAASPRCGGYDVEESPRRPGQPSMSRLIPAAHLPTAFRLTPRGESSAVLISHAPLHWRRLPLLPRRAAPNPFFSDLRLLGPQRRAEGCGTPFAALLINDACLAVLQASAALHCTASACCVQVFRAERDRVEWSGQSQPDHSPLQG